MDKQDIQINEDEVERVVALAQVWDSVVNMGKMVRMMEAQFADMHEWVERCEVAMKSLTQGREREQAE